MEIAELKLREKYSQLPLPLKATVWFTVCNFLIKGLNFITGPIFTRLLPTDEYGRLSVFLTFEQLLLILSTWEIQLGAYQKGLFKYKDDGPLFTTSTQALINLLTLSFFGLLFAFRSLVFQLTGITTTMLLVMFAYFLVFPAYNLWLVRKRKAYQYKSSIAVTLLFSLSGIVAPIVALLFFEKTADTKIIFTLLGTCTVCVFFYLKQSKFWILPKNLDKVQQHWKFCLSFEGPLVFHSLSFLVLGQADRVMIKEMVGSSQTAFYSVAYTIASIVLLFQSSINTTLSPWRYQMLEEKKYDIIKNITTRILLLFAGIIAVFVLIAPEVLRIFYPASYRESMWCIPPLTVSAFFMFLYSFFVSIEEYYEKTRFVLYASVFCATVNIILNYFCIKRFGYVAGAYTTLASYILFAVCHYLFAKRVLRIERIKQKVTDLKVMLIIAGSLLVYMALITILYEYLYVRYGLLLILLISAVFLRKKIVALFKQIRT